MTDPVQERAETSGRWTPARRWALALTALAYVAAIWIAFRTIDRETLNAVLSIPFSLVALLLALSLVNYGVRVWRWLFLTARLDLPAPPRLNALYYLSGYSLTSTPGKAGEAIRMWYLKKGHGVDFVRSLPLMICDRVLDIWAMLMLAMISVAGFASYSWQIGLLALIIAAGSIPILAPNSLVKILRAGGQRLPLLTRIADAGAPVAQSMSALNSWTTYLATLGPTMIGWLAECAALYFLLRYFGAEITLLHAIFIFAFGLIVGAISFLPGGLGGTEATMIFLLRALDVDLSTAIAATAIIRVTTFWFAVLIGLALTPFALKAVAAKPQGAAA